MIGKEGARSPDRMERVPLESLIPYANNARKHSDEQIGQLQASIREFGFISPVLVDADLNVIAGHGRIEAARREGMTDVPAVFVEHLTDQQRRAYILADNKLAEGSRWDTDLLRLELTELADIDFGQFGFKEMTIPEAILDHILEEEEYTEDDSDAPEKARKRITRILEELPADAVDKALCIVIPKDRGGARDCLIFTDESCQDIVAELKRYADMGDRSPLARLTSAMVNYAADA